MTTDQDFLYSDIGNEIELQVQTLVCSDLREFAKKTKEKIRDFRKQIKNDGYNANLTKIQSELNKIAMNFNAKQDIFNTTFINQEKGLKEVMLLVDETLKIN